MRLEAHYLSIMEGIAREPYLSAIHRCLVHRGIRRPYVGGDAKYGRWCWAAKTGEKAVASPWKQRRRARDHGCGG